MNSFSKSRVLFNALNTLLICIISSSIYASYKQWPLRHKGEIRYLKMIKVYDISLYSPSVVTAENILDTNISKCLKLDYAVRLSVDKFRLATLKILKRQHSAEYLKTIEQPLETLQSAYKAVNAGDYYRLCYNANSKLIKLDLNDINLVEINSPELAKAYFGIWLSNNKPISAALYHSFFVKSH